MGACGSQSNKEDVINRKIEYEQQVGMKRQEEVIKLLLLGAGESGKSTIFRQLRVLYGKPFSEEEIRNMISVVHVNIIANLLVVLQNVGPKGAEVVAKSTLDNFLAEIDEETVITPELAEDIKTLWNDPGIQSVWAQRSSLQVLDALAYFLKPENLARVSSKSYLPTQLDCMHARVRTSGIVEEKYVVDGVQFSMFDVGGQRNERKKWIHAFDGVTAVIFVSALNEYDLVLFEDNRTERMAESIKLFDEIANSQWFAKTSIILFLNKKDLFREKIFKIPYRLAGVRNDDFKGPYCETPGADPEECIRAATNHTLSKFLAVKKDTDKEIYHHITCATDTHNIQVVFNACKDIILRHNLVDSGFMT